MLKINGEKVQKLEFKISKKVELVKAIINELPFLSRFDVKKLLDNKDVKVNGVRTKDNILLNSNDNVTVFYREKNGQEWFSEIYKDDNILIVNKRAGIEIISEKERDLISILQKIYLDVYPVHRIDRNTEGIVVFALNKTAEQELLEAFKTRNGIIKKYALLVSGRVDLTKIKRTVYLKKVESLSKVWISEVKTSGYDPISTEFNVIEYRGEKTLLEANLITGKTHQIRAHIAYYGYPIVGDLKYGKTESKQMCLTANYLAFNFKKSCKLAYLNNKNFEIVPTWL